jgi:hypothetical protein
MQRALLLDDEEIERTILETILAEADSVVCASSISPTPSVSSYGYFDIAILDLSVCGQTESQVLELCNKVGGYSGSGHDRQRDYRTCVAGKRHIDRC